MFVQHTKIEDYIHSCDVEKLPITYDDKMEVNLFGNKILVEKNEWLWHLHLKLTDACNARCFFCVEQNSKCQENAKYFISQVDSMLSEMEQAGILYSVSVTGGEPLLFKRFNELCEVLGKHDIKFLTMNTNAKYLNKYMVFVPYRGKPVVIKNGEVVSTDNMTSFDVDWAYDRRTDVSKRRITE